MSYITYKVEVYENGTKEWYLNGKLHREDGPAIEYPSGNKLWWLNHVKYTEEEFNRKMSPAIEMTVAEVEEALGKKVKIIK